MNELINNLIQLLQMLPNEGIGVLIYLAALGTMFVLHYFFGKEGLFLFIVLSVVLGNIQALKAIELVFFNDPVAMGSILFTSNYLATDILTEYYGKKQAEKAIWLGFSSMVVVSLFMVLTLGTKVPIADPGTPLYRYVEVNQAIALIFTPTPAIFLASLIAYLTSQYTDMAFFLWMKKRTKGRLLGLRTICSTFLSVLIDNCIFSFLAWRVFYPLPIDFRTLLVTYVIGTFILRIVVGLANAPFIYAIRYKNRMNFAEA